MLLTMLSEVIASDKFDLFAADEYTTYADGGFWGGDG